MLGTAWVSIEVLWTVAFKQNHQCQLNMLLFNVRREFARSSNGRYVL